MTIAARARYDPELRGSNLEVEMEVLQFGLMSFGSGAFQIDLAFAKLPFDGPKVMKSVLCFLEASLQPFFLGPPLNTLLHQRRVLFLGFAEH